VAIAAAITRGNPNRSTKPSAEADDFPAMRYRFALRFAFFAVFFAAFLALAFFAMLPS
jgi:hypothetical protein